MDKPGINENEFKAKMEESYFDRLDVMGWKIGEPIPDGENWIYLIEMKEQYKEKIMSSLELLVGYLRAAQKEYLKDIFLDSNKVQIPEGSPDDVFSGVALLRELVLEKTISQELSDKILPLIKDLELPFEINITESK